MSLIIVGEASTKKMDKFPAFVEQPIQVPWRSMRGVRNRIAHGYFDINFDVVWDTVQTALPELIIKINLLRQQPNDCLVTYRPRSNQPSGDSVFFMVLAIRKPRQWLPNPNLT